MIKNVKLKEERHFKLLQIPTHLTGVSLNNVRRKTVRYFRSKEDHIWRTN